MRTTKRASNQRRRNKNPPELDFAIRYVRARPQGWTSEEARTIAQQQAQQTIRREDMANDPYTHDSLQVDVAWLETFGVPRERARQLIKHTIKRSGGSITRKRNRSEGPA